MTPPLAFLRPSPLHPVCSRGCPARAADAVLPSPGPRPRALAAQTVQQLYGNGAPFQVDCERLARKAKKGQPGGGAPLLSFGCPEWGSQRLAVATCQPPVPCELSALALEVVCKAQALEANFRAVLSGYDFAYRDYAVRLGCVQSKVKSCSGVFLEVEYRPFPLGDPAARPAILGVWRTLERCIADLGVGEFKEVPLGLPGPAGACTLSPRAAVATQYANMLGLITAR